MFTSKVCPRNNSKVCPGNSLILLVSSYSQTFDALSIHPVNGFCSVGLFVGFRSCFVLPPNALWHKRRLSNANLKCYLLVSVLTISVVGLLLSWIERPPAAFGSLAEGSVPYEARSTAYATPGVEALDPCDPSNARVV